MGCPLGSRRVDQLGPEIDPIVIDGRLGSPPRPVPEEHTKTWAVRRQNTTPRRTLSGAERTSWVWFIMGRTHIDSPFISSWVSQNKCSFFTSAAHPTTNKPLEKTDFSNRGKIDQIQRRNEKPKFRPYSVRTIVRTACCQIFSM